MSPKVYICPFKFIIGKGACKVPCANCQISIRKSHPDMAFPTRSPLKQVRSPSGAPPEPLEIQGGAPRVPFCFRLESAATHEGILCGKLPPCYVVAINYQPTGQSSGYSRATRQACIFLTPGALLAPAGRSLESSSTASRSKQKGNKTCRKLYPCSQINEIGAQGTSIGPLCRHARGRFPMLHCVARLLAQLHAHVALHRLLAKLFFSAP